MVILIVEPKLSLRRAIRNTLERAGFVALVESSSSEDVLNRLNRMKPAVIIIGRDLGEHDAATFSRAIRQREEYRLTPILMVTARTMDEDILEAVEAGVDECIVIPLNQDILIEKTRKALERARRNDEIARAMKSKSRFINHSLVLDLGNHPNP